MSLDWSNVRKELFASSSWDGTIKLVGAHFSHLPISYADSALIQVESERSIFSGYDSSRYAVLCSPLPLCLVKAMSFLVRSESPSTCIYQTLFSPHKPNILASVSSTGTFKSFDTRTPLRNLPGGLSQPVLEVQCQEGEALTFDWNKYNQGVNWQIYASSRQAPSR